MRLILLSTAGLLLPFAAASAQVMSVGTNPGRACYEAARDESRSERALAICTEALGYNLNAPFDRVATLVNRGIVRMYRRDYDGALADYDRALAERPTHPEAMLNKGIVVLRAPGRAEEARGLFDAALAAKTSKPELAYLARGIAHEQLGNIQAAYRDYVQAAALQPDWQLARQELKRFRPRGATGGGAGQGAL